MERLDNFNISPNDFQKYGIKTDPETGLELATEYEKLCQIRLLKANPNSCKCQNCINLSFSFSQENYQIHYFCKKNKDENLTFDGIQTARLCNNFSIRKEE